MHLTSVSSRTEFKQGGSNVKSISLNSIMGYMLAMRGNYLLCRPIFDVHLDSNCVCTISEALLPQVTKCACTVYTLLITRVVFLREATTLAAAHVLQTTAAVKLSAFLQTSN